MNQEDKYGSVGDEEIATGMWNGKSPTQTVTLDHNAPQPAPSVGNALPPVWPMVVEDLLRRYADALPSDLAQAGQGLVDDMRRRDEIGAAKYGTQLRPRNGRDALVDAYQESLDQVVYLRQLYWETGTSEAFFLYDDALRLVIRVWRALVARDGR